MSPEVQAFASGFPIALLHAAASLLVWSLGVLVYAFLSPFKEAERARAGDDAARISLAGAAIGLALPLSVSLGASASVVEIALWGVGLTAAQLTLFRAADAASALLVPDRAGAPGAVLAAAARLSTAMLLAAAVAG
jgi:putative membrane protein